MHTNIFCVEKVNNLCSYYLLFIALKSIIYIYIRFIKGASGVGTAAIQLAKEFGNKEIFVTAGKCQHYFDNIV